MFLSRVIKATYVLVHEDPVTIEQPEIVYPLMQPRFEQDQDEDEIAETTEDIEERLRFRINRIQDIERSLEEQRLAQIAEIEALAKKSSEDIEAERERTRAELADLREESLAKGYAEGIENGIAEGRRVAAEECQEMLENARRMLQEAADEARRRVMEGEKDILTLATAIATKIIDSEISQREKLTVQQIRTALKNFKQVPQVIIRVPQSRYAIVVESLTSLKEEFRQVMSIDCISDPTLPLSDVVVDSPFGMMDIRYDAQLSILHKTLLELIEEQEL